MGRCAVKRLLGVNTIYLNGTNSYIDAGHSEYYQSTTITAEAWFKLLSLPAHAAYGAIIMNYVNNADFFLRLYYNGTINCRLSKYQTDNIVSNAVLEVDHEYHVVFAVSNTDMFLYINGVLDKSKVLAYSPRLTNNEHFHIGAWNGGSFLNADMYVAALYHDVCWDAPTVADRYANLSMDIVPDNCCMFYNGREIGNTVPDRSDHNNDGIPYNINKSINRVRKMRRYNGADFTQKVRKAYWKDTAEWKGVQL
jgi:hypothetical protein